jgi:hypothetical protein
VAAREAHGPKSAPTPDVPKVDPDTKGSSRARLEAGRAKAKRVYRRALDGRQAQEAAIVGVSKQAISQYCDQDDAHCPGLGLVFAGSQEVKRAVALALLEDCSGDDAAVIEQLRREVAQLRQIAEGLSRLVDSRYGKAGT